MSDEIKSPADLAQEKLNRLVVLTAYQRATLYRALRTDTLDPDDENYEEQVQKKGILLIQKLHEWSKSPLTFIRECAWAPDRKGRFGSGHIPKELGLPANMVPIIPYARQVELIETFHKMIESPYESALGAVKSRQVAFTTIFMWLALWAWLFHPNGAGVVTTYEEKLVDRGGKGQRTPETLFGRLRMFLDAFITCLPDLRFNPKAHVRRSGYDQMTDSGLGPNEDIAAKLTRPKWFVHGRRMFEEAEGNYLAGDIPGDSFGRSFSVNFVMMDEIGQYDKQESGRAASTWKASVSAAKTRFAWGTIPETGGTGSFFYQLMHPDSDHSDDSGVMSRIFCHWSDIVPYMAGAEWICKVCKAKLPYEGHGPGTNGRDAHCDSCGCDQTIGYADLTSPWFERQCQIMLQDKVGIARELQMDWMAAQGDVVFSNLDTRSLVIPYRDASTSHTLEGFDPGQSMKNAGAWVSARFCPKSIRLAIVGYWMSVNPHPEYWVPFMKHWSSRQMQRNRIIYGKLAGKTFMEAFEYPDEALKLMDHMSQFPLGDLRGDKYGSHMNAGTSTYDVLYDYGILVDWTKTEDREDLVRNGVEWAARMSCDGKVAHLKPPTPFGGKFPSPTDCFQTAKPPETKSEAGPRKLDVSKEKPRHVHNFCDAWFYLCRDLDQVHAMVNAGGHFAAEPLRDPEVLSFGDDLDFL